MAKTTSATSSRVPKSATEYDKVPDMIDEFVARIVELGPNPFKGM